ncbi:lantibiotic dehydratase [Streptomyces sp. NPDC014894]|uniref:lantibiotic dehydratase n=1 Tax=Streptomyces sp. NPDC014894 TaxID=3364931 RepID=UPI0036FC9790
MTAHADADYRWQGTALLRATTSTGFSGLPRDLDLEDPVLIRDWLVQIWRRDKVREALEVATPVLCEAVDAVIRGQQTQPRRIRRIALSMASYLLRWQHRPTPLGLFAGTAPLLVGSEPSVRWGTKTMVSARADAEWITDAILRLQSSPGLRERLPVMSNNAAHVRGERLVAPGPPADIHAALLAPVEISVRNSRPVAAARAAAQRPIVYRELRSRLRTLFPSATAAQIDMLLSDLISHNLLITSLWAPMTTVDALAHLCAELRVADAEAVDDVRKLVQGLYAVHEELSGQRPIHADGALGGTIARMRALSPVTTTPVLVDTVLDCDVQIPRSVVEEAQRAVTALYRTTAQPYGYQHWQDYHRRFRVEYGPGTYIPVLDLVSDAGLGLPADYAGSERDRIPKPLTDRDGVLLPLVQQAVMAGRDELLLTDAVIDALAEAAGNQDRMSVPRAELSFEIHSRSTTALARGAFRLVLTGVPRSSSSMAGRFAHLLPADQQDALAATYRSDTTTVAAQLSFVPRRRRNENIARAPRLLPHVIGISEHRGPDDGAISLTDIAVTADDHGFHLVQVSSGKRIDVRVPHALEAGVHTPPLARFLAEIATARHAVYKPFDYGVAARLPYLPRVRYRRTVLTPARWLLIAADLPGRTATAKEWDHALDAWRNRLRIPDRVTMVEHDQRLPLDLTHRAHRRILRSHLDRTHRLVVREAPDSDAHGWLGRAHEVWLPFVRSTAPEGQGEHAVPPTAVLIAEDEVHLPGAGTILRAHLHGHPQRYDEILDRYVPRLLARFGDPVPMWWFTRHHEASRPDVDSYLDLVLHIEPGTYGAAAEHVHVWAHQLHRSGLASRLTLAGHRPHTGRYGHGTAMDTANILFSSDSAAALAQIRCAEGRATTSQALTAASILNLVRHLAPTPADGESWLIEQIPKGTGQMDRNLREQAIGFTTGTRTLTALPGGAEVIRAWSARTGTVRDYRRALADERDPLTTAHSLIRQHHIRALGVDPATEATTLRFARNAALHHRRGTR